MFNRYVLLIVILIFFTYCGADSNCCQKVSLDYLDAAVDFIGKAKSNFPSVNCENNKSGNAMDCSELLEMGYKKSGVYTIWPKSRIIADKPLEVYCDMQTDGGGWTLIQRRRRSVAWEAEDFDKDWRSYKEGFGDIQKQFWLGNDNIFALTNQRLYSARFDLRSEINETIYAHYNSFWIDDEYNKYTLHIADYKGDAGDAMTFHQNQKFSTKDEDNDNITSGSCVEVYRGGWWYNGSTGEGCYNALLNGRQIFFAWNHLGRVIPILQTSEIKIRPRNFKPSHASLK